MDKEEENNNISETEEMSTADKLKKLEELWQKEKEFLDSLGVESN
jgi:hypothetical protein